MGMSFRAIGSPQVDDDKQWLTFWVAHSALQAETLLDVTRISSIIPFYFLVKFALMIALLFGGAAKVYDVILAPLFQMVEQHVSKDDLELLDNDPSAFIKKYGAKVYEKSSIKAEELKSKMKTKAADKLK